MAAAPASGSAAGFTLLEMLVVLAILATLAVLAPSPFAGLPGLRLRAAADDLVDVLRQSRDRAVRRGNTVDLDFDVRSLSYTVTGGTGVRRLPAVVEAMEFQGPQFLAGAGATRFRFFADGSATAGSLKLVHGQSTRRISVDWLTGRARRDD